MTTSLVTFSDSSMSRSAELCVESGYEHGVDNAQEWSRQAIENSNYVGEARRRTLELMERGSRGAGGWWCWKPYIIHDTLCQLGNGYLVYSDAGIEFINNVNYIVDRMDQDIFLFGNNWEHAHWCKRDVVNEIWRYDYPPTDTLWSCFDKQVQASVIFFRVSDYTRTFVKEWLDWCLFEGGRLIDDSPSRAPNHPEFQENRHDQSILTTMAYRDGIKLHAWPAVYNRFLGQEFVYPRDAYPDSDNYPSLFHHHRLRNVEFDAIRPNVETAVTV